MVTKLIFTIISKDSENLRDSIGLLGKSFSQVQKDFSNTKGFDRIKSIFSDIGKEAKNNIALLDEINIAPIIDQYTESFKKGQVATVEFVNSLDDDNLKKYFNSLNDGTATVRGYTQFTDAAIKSQTSMGISAQIASVGVRILQVALNAFIGVLIVTAISSFVQWLTTLKTEAEMAAEAIQKQIEKIKTLNDEISKLDSDLSNLKGIENKTKAQENYIKVLERELEIKRELERQEQEKLYQQKYGQKEQWNPANGSWLTDLTGITDPNAPAKITVDPIVQLTRSIKIYQDTLKQLETAETTEDIERLTWAVSQQEKSFAETYRELYDFKEAMGELPPEAEALMDALYKIIDKQSAFSQALENDQSLKNYAEQLRGLSDIDLKAINFDDTEISKGEVAFKALVDAANEYGLSVEGLIDILVNLGYIQGTEVSDTFNQTSADLEKLSESLLKTIGDINTLAEIQQKLAKNGGIDASSLQSIIQLYPQAIKYANDFAGMQKFIADQMVALENTALIVYGNMVLADADAVNLILNNHNQLVAALITYYGADYANFVKLSGEKYVAEAATVQKLSELWAKYASVSATSIRTQIDNLRERAWHGGLNAETQAILDDLQLYEATFISMEQEFKSFEAAAVPAFNNVGNATKSAKDATKELEQALKAAQSAINGLLEMTIKMLEQQYKNAEKSENEAYKASKKALDKRKKDLQDLQKDKKKAFDDDKKRENELYSQQKKRYDAEKKALQDATKVYQEQIKLKLQLLDKQEDERDYQRELQEKQRSVANIESQLLSIQYDTSESAAKKRRELELQLAQAKESLSEYQHNRDIELQKDALNQVLDEFQASQQSKLDALESQWEIEQLQHEARLANIEAQQEAWQETYDRRMEAIDAESERLTEAHEAEIERIQKLANDEVAIREQAIKLIEGKSEEFKNQLIEWNLQYGDHTKSTVEKVWNDAYAVLDSFNGKQIDVQYTLETLANKMNSFKSEIDKAASAMEKLAKQSQNVKPPPSGGYNNPSNGFGIFQAHTGTESLGNTPLQKHTGNYKSNEMLIVGEKGETILSNRKSSSDVQNALGYLEDALPANSMQAMLAAFVNDSSSIQELIASPTSPSGNLSSFISNKMLANNVRILSSVDGYKKLPINEVHTHEYNIDNSKEIIGYDVSTMKKIANEQDESLLKKINNMTVTRGAGRNLARS